MVVHKEPEQKEQLTDREVTAVEGEWEPIELERTLVRPDELKIEFDGVTDDPNIASLSTQELISPSSLAPEGVVDLLEPEDPRIDCTVIQQGESNIEVSEQETIEIETTSRT